MNSSHRLQMTAALTLLLLGASTFAAGLKDADVAFKSGNWKVLRSVDSMKDTVDCTGIFKENYGVQLTGDTLFVSVKGGLQSVTLRFADKPARSMRLPEDLEKKLGSIIISGSDFSELLESDRLRVQAMTLVRGIATEDFELVGIKDALESIRSGCPVQPKTSAPHVVEKPSAVSTCTEQLLSRMKAQGLRESQIQAICK
jgi:hypothetical protein